jgi:hypothetical protein
MSTANSYTITENEKRTEQTKIKSEVKECKTGYDKKETNHSIRQ